MVSLRLEGNPVCSSANLLLFCGSQSMVVDNNQNPTNFTCQPQSCPAPYQYSRVSTTPCFCAVPLLIGYRLKSPGFSDFRPYRNPFIQYLTSGLSLLPDQLEIDSSFWIEGPRLQMYVKLFPVYSNQTNDSHTFNRSEVLRIRRMFSGWKISDSDLFGPYELLNFTLLGPYIDGLSQYHI